MKFAIVCKTNKIHIIKRGLPLRKLFVVFGLLLIVVLGSGFFVLNKTPAKNTESQPKNQMEAIKPEVLQRGVDPNTYPKYESNFNLYFAHLNASVFVDKSKVNNGGKPLSAEDYKSILNEMKKNLSEIKYDNNGEKKAELDKAIKLVNQAIQSKAKKGDPIFNEIHQTIHDLDVYFNTTHFVDE